MEKLALSDEILMTIEKPARYIGGEINHVKKDLSQVDIRFAMCFPDVYEIGMSHLGIQILYDMLNKRADTWCERVYSPWVDLDRVMREQKIPLFALESQTPIKAFDFLGITLQYEMCYTNILQVLDLSGIPLWASERTEDDPIVIGGGPCTYNPEPIADFFDMFYIGEGEVVYDTLLDLYKECRKNVWDRAAFLREAAKIPGIYVPSLYNVGYHPDGTISNFTPKYEDIPQKITKQVVMDMSDATYPEKPLVPFIKVTQDRAVLEVMRGCIRGCRFCQAGMIYRPVRNRSLEDLKRYAVEIIENTGHEEISLSSLSSSDFTELPELLNFLIEEMGERKVNISLPSLRIDAFSLDVMSKVQDIRRTSLTFAPEAGTQKQRNVINKGLTEEDIIEGARQAFLGGWNKVKLYFMLSQPFETYDDIAGIADLSERIAEVYYDTVPKEERTGGPVSITASASFFVPKPFTPFQWAPMDTMESFQEKAHFVKDRFREQLNKKRLRFTYHSADVSLLEGILARGDRRLAPVILEVYKNGGIFDAWSEFYSHERWMKAFENHNLDPEFYLTRERAEDELFPWDFIDIGVTKRFLLEEWHRAKEGRMTPNCRMSCSGCGVAKWGGGVCIEAKN
ncbi:MAG: TIGR03960 family B12-binding radical SAM protein [Lachnospiraceae bacterium]|nr:TIGR03960 family B12-binding radical SAM protein [Lachnospiraceae bacterium]